MDLQVLGGAHYLTLRNPDPEPNDRVHLMHQLARSRARARARAAMISPPREPNTP